METRAIPKTRRVDSMGNGNNCGGDDFTGDYCVCFASEREGKDCCNDFDKSSVLIFFPSLVTQREDELERRRVSHHINFDAL